MSAPNFYENGNHGLNVIHDEDEIGDFQVYDVLGLIVSELADIGYSVDDVRNWIDTPRSYETGIQYAVYEPNGKLVAVLEVCTGYYSGANVNIYTGDLLVDELGDKEYYNISVNKKLYGKVVDVIKRCTTAYHKTAQFSNGEAIYELA